MKRIRKFKKDFELDLLLAVDELLNEPNVCFGGIPILLEMKEREFGKSYLTPIKSMKYMVNMIFSIVFIRAITRKK